MKERIIFHIDVNNAFLSWTAVKLLNEGYEEDIRKIPSVIGGNEKERKGIVLAKSPVAKKYHIQTAETLYQARKKCPRLQVFAPDYDWYVKKSRELFTYLSKYSPTMQKFSIDECFLDMTGTSYLYKNYLELAYFIKDDIKEKFGYTVNIGIGNNKLCAKMASDFEKPDKVHTLLKDEIVQKLWPLDVGDLLLVGKKTKELLNKLNIYTIEDLAKTDIKILKKHFKSQAEYLKNAAFGIDNSKVESRSSQTKSISISETLSYDCTKESKLEEILFVFTEKATRDLRYQKQYAKTVAVFYKNNKFENYSAQEKLPKPTNSTKEIYHLVIEIFRKSYKNDPIRLIGIRLADLTEKSDYQLSLFDNNDTQDEKNNIQATLDNINKKYGKSLIAPASIKMIDKKDKVKGRGKLY